MLAASDSHFSIAAAQISLGVQLRIRRQGFAAADVQHMIPLPLMATDAEARARVRVNRNRGCAEVRPPYLPTSPHISLDLPRSPCISGRNRGCAEDEAVLEPYLPISPHISPYLPKPPQTSP